MSGVDPGAPEERGLTPAVGAVHGWQRSAVVQTLLLAAVSIALLALLLLATGHAPGPALAALFRGAFGSSYALLSATPVRAVPLALAGLAVAIAFRAGLLNVGAEGQLLVGGTAAAAVAAYAVAHPGLPASIALLLMLGAGAVAGSLWAGIAAWLRGRFGVLEVISTIMLNFVALYLVGYLVRGPLQEPTRINPQSASLPASPALCTSPPPVGSDPA